MIPFEAGGICPTRMSLREAQRRGNPGPFALFITLPQNPVHRYPWPFCGCLPDPGKSLHQPPWPARPALAAFLSFHPCRCISAIYGFILSPSVAPARRWAGPQRAPLVEFRSFKGLRRSNRAPWGSAIIVVLYHGCSGSFALTPFEARETPHMHVIVRRAATWQRGSLRLTACTAPSRLPL